MHKQAQDSLEEDAQLRDDRRSNRRLSRDAHEGRERETPPLVKHAVWCGCVFSLAALITALNCLPPVNVHFRVRAQVVASPQRIAALQAKLRSDSKLQVGFEESGIQLCGLAVLDKASKPSLSSVSLKDNVKLIEVHSRWLGRTSTAELRKWLDGISQVRDATRTDNQVNKRDRFAKWQSDTAEHYLAHHFHTTATLPVSNHGEVAQDSLKLSAKSPMRLVGVIKPGVHLNAPDSNVSTELSIAEGAAASLENERTRGQLEECLASARDAAQQTALERERYSATDAGMLAISGSPEIRAEAGSIPLWLASSVLVFALACGSSAGWMQHRLQSGGAFEPEAVATKLATDGLAVVDRLNLTTLVNDSSDWLDDTSRRAAKLSRRLACGLTNISECVVMIWCCGIALRFVFDPLWRNVLVDSPLAALGRLIVGLP